MARPAPAPDYSAPALEKGLDILEALARAPKGMTLTEVAAHLDRTQAEIFRMIACLATRGYLMKDEASGRYRLSLRLHELAHTHSPMDLLVPQAREVMAGVVERLDESCHLSVISGGQLLVLAQAEAHRPIRISVEVGGRFPLWRTASGRLLLAHLGEDELAAITRKLPTEARAAATPAKLELLRRDGCCLAVEESVRGVVDLAVLVGNPASGSGAALTVTGFNTRPPEEFRDEALPTLRKAAQEIDRRLGLRI
jgi:DNA-binding IclR family transcriptional regulator